MSNKKRKATILFDKIIGEPVFAISRFLIPVSKVKPKKIDLIHNTLNGLDSHISNVKFNKYNQLEVEVSEDDKR